MPFSNYLAAGLINAITRGAAAPTISTIKIGLSTTVPTAAGTNITNPAGVWYADQTITPGVGEFTESTAKATGSSNINVVNFGDPTEDVTLAAICWLDQADNLLYWDPDTTVISVGDDSVIIPAGNLVFNISNFANLSEFLANAFINYITRGTALPAITALDFGVSETVPTAAGTNITEPSAGTWYARQSVTNNITNFSAASGGVGSSNNADISFTDPDASSTVVAEVVWDNAGNYLWHGDYSPSKVLDTGKQFRIVASGHVFNLATS